MTKPEQTREEREAAAQRAQAENLRQLANKLGACAFPVRVETEVGAVLTGHGTSKRELFAAMAMQGIATHRNYSAQERMAGYPKIDAEIAAEAAVRHADALIAALAGKAP